MKDKLKIVNNRDRKQIQKEKENLASLQDQGLYPTKFNFPITLQYELTTHCNVKCKHCYNNSGIDNNYKDRMSSEKWIEFSKYIVEHGGIFQCVISGGEPLLLGDDLFKIMDILHDDGTAFLLITNGYLLDEKKVKKLSKYRYKWLQVSIDGSTAEYHDSFRNRKGSWERAVKGAYLVSKEGIPLTIAHTVTPQNLDKVDDMCELAYSLGAGSIILGQVNPSGRSAENMDIVLNHNEKNILLEKIEENIRKYSGKMEVQRSSTVKNQLLRYKDSPNSGAIIRPNGDIRLDCMAPFVIGNVLDNDFCDVWAKKAENCWKNDLVKQYIDAFDDLSDINIEQKNYYDKDIYL